MVFCNVSDFELFTNLSILDEIVLIMHQTINTFKNSDLEFKYTVSSIDSGL